MATLSFSLWAANFLPIQAVQYRLTTNLAVSQHRMPKLRRLMSDGSSYAAHSIRVIGLESSATDPAQATNSELCSVRAVVALDTRAQVSEVEKLLDALTEPSSEPSECAELTRQIRQQRWLVESIQHSLQRLSLDQERERSALVEDESMDSNSPESAITESSSPQTSPFRLTSHSNQVNLEREAARLQKQLQLNSTTESEKLDAMLLALERLRAKARGFISMTGSPKLVPVVRSMTFGRFSILVILCFLVWSLCMAWVRPTPLQKKRSQPGKAIQSLRLPNLPWLNTQWQTASHRREGRHQTLEWMSKVGIPYLGEVRIEGGKQNNSDRSPAPSSREDYLESSSPVNTAVISRDSSSDQEMVKKSANKPEMKSEQSVQSLPWMRNLSEGSLVLWLGLLLGRAMFDPAWRELVCVAPLAAISRMLFGIQ